MEHNGPGPHGPISVFLADDNLIVREGVRALINARKDLNVVGVAADYGELVNGAEQTLAEFRIDRSGARRDAATTRFAFRADAFVRSVRALQRDLEGDGLR